MFNNILQFWSKMVPSDNDVGLGFVKLALVTSLPKEWP